MQPLDPENPSWCNSANVLTNPIKISSTLCRWPGQNDKKLGKLLGQKMVNKIDYFVHMHQNYFDEEFCNTYVGDVARVMQYHFQDLAPCPKLLHNVQKTLALNQPQVLNAGNIKVLLHFFFMPLLRSSHTFGPAAFLFHDCPVAQLKCLW